MAQLKDTVVSGSLRATDSLLTTTLQTKILNAPTESNGTTFGPGTNKRVLISNGTSVYWGTTTAITQVGTITSGTWNATVINPNKGGTGVNSYAKGDILYAGAAITSTATTALSKLTIGTSGQVLETTSSGLPGWITATDSSTGSTIVKRDASGGFSAGTITASLSGNADTATALTSNAGDGEQPIYFTSGKPSTTTYALKATVNNGDTNYVAYYSGERAISSSKSTTGMLMPAHYFHNLYNDNPTTGTNVYVHYYNNNTTSTNTFANLRVKAGNAYKTLAFGGDGTFTWDGTSVVTNSGSWGISVTGSSGSCTGNAATVSRATFGDASNGEHNANNITSNGLYYYTSNGPSDQLGARSTDGSIYCQNYDSNWVSQIAQDYRDGGLYVRGKNNGTWQKWLQVPLVDLSSSAITNCNSVYRTGIYTNAGFTNRPGLVNDWSTLLNLKLYESNNNYHRQLLFDCYSSDRIWTRSCSSGLWTDWKMLLNVDSGVSRYHVGSTASNSYILVTINAETSWMLNFTLKLYQSYVATDIQISGYNYGANHWYSPQAVILGSTTTSAIKVYFGYTADWKLWIAVDGGNYNGADVVDMCNGHTQIDPANAFTLTKVNSLPGTTQTTVTAYRPYYRNETVSNATTAASCTGHATSDLALTGGQMTGTITMTTAAAAAATSTPTALSYGRLQAYGTLCINANTDNSGTEYVILTAGHGCSSSTSEGFWVGSDSAGCAYSITAPSFWISGAPGANNCIQVGSGDANGNGGANWVLRSWYGIGIMSGCTSVNNGVITAGVDARYGYIYSGRTYNAVWNDFAEFRESDIDEPGRVLISNGKGQMVLCDRRLVAGAKIISDTFGCSVGESDSAKTPLGVAGRVLVYTYQNRDNYKVGDAVCAAPNGTVDIMTREEIKEYPDRIIGIVDEIPIYKRWEQYRTCKNENNESVSNKVSDIEVKGRIWIYVK